MEGLGVGAEIEVRERNEPQMDAEGREKTQGGFEESGPWVVGL